MKLDDIEIAYYLDKDEFEYNEDVNIHVSYGHAKSLNNTLDENDNLPFCLFLDYGNDVPKDNNDYTQFNGYQLIEEIEPNDFYTSKYMYDEEGYEGKKFAYTTSFAIPFKYFENMFLINPNYNFKIIAGQLYLSKTDEAIHMYAIKSAETELNFNYDSSNKRLKILF